MRSHRFTEIAAAGLSLSAGIVQAKIAVTDVNDSSYHQGVDEVQALNALSERQVEASWLKIPPLCKARSIAAEPVVVPKHKLHTSIQAIHAQLDARIL